MNYLKKQVIVINDIVLELPNIKYKEKAKEFVKEHFDNGEKSIHGGSGIDKIKDYDKWLEIVKKNTSSDTVQEGYVPATTFFAIKDDDIVGIIQIRHILNEKLFKYGGHIGYSIRPTKRQKGYGTKMLKLALKYCKKLDLDRVLISCYSDNIASEKTIKKCNGKFENKIYYDIEDIYIKRFWINL